MSLQEIKVGFEVDRIQLFLEKLEDPEIEWFWQAISNIHDVFPNIDIYLAGSVKGKGYIGFGIKPNVTEKVKDFLLVSHLKNNDNGNYFFKLEVIQALADFIAEHDPKFSLNFSYKNLVTEKFADWLHKLKEYAIQFGMTLNGQGLLPLDYQNQSLTTAQVVEYLKERYPDTYSGTSHIATFKTSLGREIALDPGTKTPIIFCDAAPPVELNLKIKQIYAETDTRNQHLSTHAKSLMLGNKAYSIIVGTLDDLEKLCDWYEQGDDQTTALEKKVQQFLKIWSIERLKNLTIQDYHQAKNTDCFIAQIDSFDPTQGAPTFANYFDIWEPINLGKDEKYHNEKPYSWNKRLGDNAEQAFEKLKQEIINIVDAVQRRDLNAIDQIQFPKGLKWMIAFLYQDLNDPCIIPVVSKVNTKRIGYDHLYPKLSLPEFLPILLKDRGEQAFFPYVEKLFAMVRKGYLDNKHKKQNTEELMDQVMSQQPLNRILFGAAGTGKTFHSINHALSIIENKPHQVLEQENRTALKTRFDQYKEQGQIKFVTFHQSFSYEDFIEGIRAEVDVESDQLTYAVKPGVFKDICEKASGQYLKFHKSENSLDNFLEEISVKPLMLNTIKNKEFKVSYIGHGHVIHCQPLASESNATYRANINSIREILQGNEPEILYNSSYVYAIANFIKQKYQPTEHIDNLLQPYVLIIDEINRGNISRIFGELITLIEDSKRQGADEELSVTLPYSKKEFSVPSNVYIIGTMNSSDRSLTGLDIALRRRFTFIEMQPKPELLNDIVVEGLNMSELLKVINQRIEVLLDRDHCIGHANFMSLKQQPKREHLAEIFKQKIIPQLQEYFFDDWAKINMVLNANGMLKPQAVVRSSLFPNVKIDSESFFEEQETWNLVETAFDSIDSFNKIIKY